MYTFKNGALDLVKIGQENLRQVRRNYSTARLVEEIIMSYEGQLCNESAVIVRTGHAMEPTHHDLFIVHDDSNKKIDHGPKINALKPYQYENLIRRMLSYIQNKRLYVQNCYASENKQYSIPIRIVTEKAWHSLFARNIYYPIADDQKLEDFEPAFSVIHMPQFQSIPELDGTRSQSAVVINLSHKVVIVCGCSYAGNIIQAVSTMIHYLVPDNFFLMRGSSCMSTSGDVAIFLGRAGTGKTTLAADSQTIFIGDSLHAWFPKGLISYERGMYPNVLNTIPDDSPEIHACIQKFGTVLENVSIDMISRETRLSDSDLTLNPRACFHKTCLSNISSQEIFPHPKHLFLVTCDPLGVLPPIIRISPEQAILSFLSSYSAVFIQTEDRQVSLEQNFCFGALSPVYPPHIYSEKLRKLIVQHDIACWVINTGWSGNHFSESSRMPIKYSRAAVRAVMSGALDQMEFSVDPVFRYRIPNACPGIPREILNPRKQAKNEADYELRANRLVAEFIKDFSKYEDQIPEDIKGLIISLLPGGDQLDYQRIGFSM